MFGDRIIGAREVGWTAMDRPLSPREVWAKEVSPVAYTINEDCIKCGACEAECPVDAISEGEETYVIDPDLCISCGACASVCPVNAPQEQ